MLQSSTAAASLKNRPAVKGKDTKSVLKAGRKVRVLPWIDVSSLDELAVPEAVSFLTISPLSLHNCYTSSFRVYYM